MRLARTPRGPIIAFASLTVITLLGAFVLKIGAEASLQEPRWTPWGYALVTPVLGLVAMGFARAYPRPVAWFLGGSGVLLLAGGAAMLVADKGEGAVYLGVVGLTALLSGVAVGVQAREGPPLNPSS